MLLVDDPWSANMHEDSESIRWELGEGLKALFMELKVWRQKQIGEISLGAPKKN